MSTRRLPAALALLGAALTLSACAGGAVAPAGPSAALLGTEPLDPERAGAIFEEACLRSLPDFAGAPSALQRLGFQPGASGTWAHPTLAIAVAPGDACAVEFAAPATAEEAGAYLGLATTGLNGTAAIAHDPATGRTAAPGPDGSRMTLDPLGEGRFRAVLTP